MASGLGFFAGGLSDSLSAGMNRNQQYDFQQKELQIQQQGQQMQQQRFELGRVDTAVAALGQHIANTIDAGKIAGEDPKTIMSVVGPLFDQYEKLTTSAGRGADFAKANLAAWMSAPPSTQIQAAQAAAKEPPGQKELRGAQTEYYKSQAKLLSPDTPDEMGAPSPGNSVPTTGGSKYISTPFTGQQKAIISRSGATPDQFDFEAVQYAYGNTAVGQGYRSYKGVNPVQTLRARATQYWQDKGLSPEQANAAMVEFQAMKHGAQTAATIDARMTEALTKAQNTAKVVMPLANKVDRTNFKDFNDFMINVRKRTGNQDEIRLGIALETLATNYGVSLGMGNSVITDTKLKQAQGMLEQGWNQGQLGAAVDQIIQELQREEAGTREGMKKFIGGMTDLQSGGGDNAFVGSDITGVNVQDWQPTPTPGVRIRKVQ